MTYQEKLAAHFNHYAPLIRAGAEDQHRSRSAMYAYDALIYEAFQAFCRIRNVRYVRTGFDTFKVHMKDCMKAS